MCTHVPIPDCCVLTYKPMCSSLCVHYMCVDVHAVRCVGSLPERSWNMWIPGYGVDDKAPKKSLTTEAHRQVLATLQCSVYPQFTATVDSPLFHSE
jgi:hypothetical protein